MYAGKTSLSRTLRKEHGFAFADYTGYLKELGAKALNNLTGDRLTKEDIEQDKANYRLFLQELGRLIDFNGGVPFVHDLVWRDAFDGWDDYGCAQLKERVIFDCVRTGAQYAQLAKMGFTLVRLVLPREEQRARAAALGVDGETLARMVAHPIETPVPFFPGEVRLDATKPTEELVEELLARGRTLALAEPAA